MTENDDLLIRINRTLNEVAARTLVTHEALGRFEQKMGVLTTSINDVGHAVAENEQRSAYISERTASRLDAIEQSRLYRLLRRLGLLP